MLTITSKDIEATGLGSIGDVMQRLSVSGSSLEHEIQLGRQLRFSAGRRRRRFGLDDDLAAQPRRQAHADPRRRLALGERIVGVWRFRGGRSQHDSVEHRRSHRDPEGRRIVAVRLRRDRRRHQHHHEEKAGRARPAHLRRRLFGRRRQDLFGQRLARRQHGPPRFLHGCQPLQAERDQLGRLRRSRVPGAGHRVLRTEVPRRRSRVTCSTRPEASTSAACATAASATSPRMAWQLRAACSFPDGFHHFTTADRFNFAPYNLLLTSAGSHRHLRAGHLQDHRQRQLLPEGPVQHARFDQPGSAGADLPRPAVLPGD